MTVATPRRSGAITEARIAGLVAVVTAGPPEAAVVVAVIVAEAADTADHQAAVVALTAAAVAVGLEDLRILPAEGPTAIRK